MQSSTMICSIVALVLNAGLTASDSSEDFNWTDERHIWRWNVEEYPHPRISPRFCHRFSPSSVCDPDDILTREKANELDLIITKVSNDTPCICPDCPEPNGGLQIGIALLRNVYKPNELESKIIKNFAENLRSSWNLGACDNDILILVATKDRLSYTDVGTGIAPYISSEEANQIFVENKAYFTAGNYFEGLKAMTENYHTISQRIKRKEDVPMTDMGLIIGLVVGFIVVLVIVLLLIFIIYKRRSKQSTGRKSSVSEDVSSSWKRKETPWMSFSSQYKPCKTEDAADSEELPDKSNKTMEEREAMEPLKSIAEESKDAEEKGKKEDDIEVVDNGMHGKTTLEPSESHYIHVIDI